MTINRTELFRLAWVWAKQDLWSQRLPASSLHGLFRRALVRAWADMKRSMATRAAQIAAATAARPATTIRTDILTIECKDRLRGSDWHHLASLNAELRGAQARHC